ncbi:hypothetical protein V6N11_053725 [Hibiscus sabdariffa]|uniref:non-specific serine/threonine protein kinase n=1 Tax=Hibiscus sabdariffa TaxID=183260 RepID=A0ABR2S1S3_9ROSI
MASLVCFITPVLSYVSIGVGFGLVSTLAARLVMLAATSLLEMEAALLSTNLVYLDLTSFGIFGSILPQIGAEQNIKSMNQMLQKNGDLFSIGNFGGKIAFQDIIEATNDFDFQYCIGTGGYGSVYREQIPSGKIVALKKLHRREPEVAVFDRSFKNEAKMLPEIRQKNIVKLYGFCLRNRCFRFVNTHQRELFFCLCR